MALESLPPRDDTTTRLLIERAVILVLLAALLVGVAQVLRPFVTAILFGATLAIATWPLRELLLRYGVCPRLAAVVLLIAAVVVILLPVLALLPSLSRQLATGIRLAQDYAATSPRPPDFLAGIPVVGRDLTALWERVVDAHGDVRALLAPYGQPIRGFVLEAAQALADSVLQLLLSLIVATMFWASGDTMAAGLHGILRHLAGEPAARALDVVAGSVRGVAYGVVGTAALQGFLMTIGLLIAGVPTAALLGFVTLLLAISQIGAALLILVWGGAAWWLFSTDAMGWAIFMVIWGLFVGTIDNFVRPWLISFGVTMPLALVILGVFGGFLSFGFLGLFVGPSLLAVVYTLVQAWRETPAHPATKK